MNKKGDLNIKLKLSFVIGLMVLLFIGLGFFIGFEFDTPIISESIGEKVDNEVNDEDTEEVTVESLLNSNYYFQDSVGVGSNFTNLYKFNSDGTFLYSSKTNVTSNGQVVLASGTWEYNDEILKLTYLVQHVSTEFNIISDDVEGIRVTDYKLFKNDVNEVKEYDIELTNADGIKYIDGDIILYYVSLTEDEINEFFSE